jgi:hypothetical protein
MRIRTLASACAGAFLAWSAASFAEHKAFLSDDAARRVVDWQAPGPVRSRGAENG